MFKTNKLSVKKVKFALKYALILSYATSTVMFFAINIIVRILIANVEMGEVPPGLPVGEGNLLDYYWAFLGIYALLFSGLFVITLINITIKIYQKETF